MFEPNVLFLSALVLSAARNAYCQIHRSNCRRAAIFNPENEDQLLVYRKNNHQSRVVNSSKVPSLLTCSGKCTATEVCRSLNFKTQGPGMNCQILDFDKNNANVELQSGTGWIHYEPVTQIGKLCQMTKPCPIGMNCTDTFGCPGYKCDLWGFKDCKDGYDKGIKTNQVYAFMLGGLSTIAAPCDLTTDGGGWTVFQRRVDGSVNFSIGWKEYKTGFGDLNGNFWLGLDNIHKLAAPGKGAILRVDMKHTTEGSKYEKYSQFEVENEANGYRLTVGGASGDASDSLTILSSGAKFTTHDKDQDTLPYKSCARDRGPWWHTVCALAYLNGKYPTTEYPANPSEYMTWAFLAGNFGTITFSEMKIKIP